MTSDQRKLLRLARNAFAEKKRLLNLHDVFGMTAGMRIRGGKTTDEPVLRVYVRRGRKRRRLDSIPPKQRIPRRVRITFRGKKHWIPVDLVETEMGRTASAPCGSDTRQNLVAGSSIGNLHPGKKTGTIGWICRNRQSQSPVVCTCFHVMVPKEVFPKGSGSKTIRENMGHTIYAVSPSLQHNGQGFSDRFGEVMFAKLSVQIDIAYIRISDQAFVPEQALSCDGQPLAPARSLSPNDIDRELVGTVTMFGRESGLQKGKITHFPADFYFDYDGSARRMYDLIETNVRSDKGDSGALLVDAGNAPLGMLIGGTNDKSFFIPISRIKVAANGLMFVDF